mgnify:CR=1 FL=1
MYNTTKKAGLGCSTMYSKYLAYQWYFSRPNIVDLDELKDVPFLQRNKRLEKLSDNVIFSAVVHQKVLFS